MIPGLPDQAWVANITFVRIQTGFVYVAVILDACSRKIVGYAISRQIDTDLTPAALKAAVRTRQPAPNKVYPPYRPWKSIRQLALSPGVKRIRADGFHECVWKSLSQRPNRKLYENLESGGGIFGRLPDVCRHVTSTALY
ncbi:DDE-type integrase/transposase/recombinase [Nitrosospira sp. Nsp1]|uniref:DDE-type integrase/transposase/recombinase n=1 Tax=Nitrosospira sp. Nsp1 TaxID=136547 RepID=UPI000B893F8E